MSDLIMELERYKAREAHFAKALRVADGGQYRADWDGAISNVLAERDRLRSLLVEARDALREVAPTLIWSTGERDYLLGCPACGAEAPHQPCFPDCKRAAVLARLDAEVGP